MTTAIDFGRTAGDYARHRAGPPAALYDRLRDGGVGVAGTRVVDLGTGTGLAARTLAARGCAVTGVDVSAPMLDAAGRSAREEGVDVRWVRAPAEATGLDAGSFDAALALQCWHWFERARAARELARVLAPGGRAAIAHFDWLELPGSAVELSVAMALARREGAPPPASLTLGRHGIYPEWTLDLAAAGFTDLETWSFDVGAAYSHEAWRGRMRASAIVGASMAPEAVEAYDRALAEALAARFPDPLVAPHRVWAVVATAPGAPLRVSARA